MEQPISYRAKPRQNLEIQEQGIIALNTRIDPVQVE
jgi:hypothetical protein